MIMLLYAKVISKFVTFKPLHPKINAELIICVQCFISEVMTNPCACMRLACVHVFGEIWIRRLNH